MDPPETFCRPRIALPMVDLPEPDSPTSPTVSPGAMLKLTPSTAAGVAAALRPRPYRTTRSLTCSSGWAAAGNGASGRTEVAVLMRDPFQQSGFQQPGFPR